MSTYHFLCNKHRIWLASDLVKAVECLFVNLKTAEALKRTGVTDKALAHAGCAYETAALILNTENIDTDNALDYFTQAALLTVELQLQLQAPQKARQLLQQAVHTLHRLTASSKPALNTSLNKLQFALSELPSPSSVRRQLAETSHHTSVNHVPVQHESVQNESGRQAPRAPSNNTHNLPRATNVYALH